MCNQKEICLWANCKDGTFIVITTESYILEASQNPKIPDGFSYYKGTPDSGYTIVKENPISFFTWVPVAGIQKDGMLFEDLLYSYGCRVHSGDGKNSFDLPKFHREMAPRIASIMRYGGFYISTYNISMNAEGKCVSVPKAIPITNITYLDAERCARQMMPFETTVRTTLPCVQDYDTILCWIKQNNIRSQKDIEMDSSDWGTYYGMPVNFPFQTGKNIAGCSNGIYDLAGGVSEWVCGNAYTNQIPQVLFGGNRFQWGISHPVSWRRWVNPEFKSSNLGFRAVLIL